MAISKAWDWQQGKEDIWLEPSEESYYYAQRWKKAGFKKILDFGSGLGRHSVYFAKQGFEVSAFDLSEDGIAHLNDWAAREGLAVDARVADMLSIPFDDGAFDCLYAYHVISHTDTRSFTKAISEIRRVLRPGGEFMITLCSKESESFKCENFTRFDENTIIKVGGPEDGVPHFYLELDDVFELLGDFEIIRVRHVDDCYFENMKRGSKHYFVLGKRM